MKIEIKSLAWPVIPPPASKSEILTYWSVYFDFMYNIGISPFHLKWNPWLGTWDIESTMPRKILVGILTLVFISNYIFNVIHTPLGNSTDPLFYFRVSLLIVNSFSISLHYVVWTKQTLVHQFFNEIQKSKLLNSKSSSWTLGKFHIHKATWIKIFTFIYLLQSLTERVKILEDEDSNIFSIFEKKALRNFGLSNLTDGFTRKFLGIVAMAMDIYVTNTYYSLQLFVLYAILLLRSVINLSILEIENVQGTSKAEMERSLQPILETYRNLKRFTHMINEISGPVTLYFVASAVVYLCQLLIFITKSSNYLEVINIFIYIMVLVITLYLAADAHKLTGRIYKWLYIKMNYWRFSQIELMVFLHDLSRNEIALGMDGCFLVTFNFLGLMLGLIISYTLIFYQLQATMRNP